MENFSRLHQHGIESAAASFVALGLYLRSQQCWQAL